MAMNRRNVLVLLAAIVIGGGLAVGTGAFSQVEADRSVNVDVSGDSSALLKISEGTSSGLVQTTGAGDSVNIIKFKETQLNDNATTTYNAALDIENNGNSDFDFYVEDSGTGVIDFVHNSSDTTVVGSTESVAVTQGGNVTIDIKITTSKTGDTFPSDVTFVADG